jgi:hypothetical protein
MNQFKFDGMHVRYISALIAVLIVWFAAKPSSAQELACIADRGASFDYDIIENTKSAFFPNTRMLRVVIKPKFFDEKHMRELARALRCRFCEDMEISALIFDNVKAAKALDMRQFLTGNLASREVRGIYALTDGGKFSSIEYSTKRGNPFNEVVLKLDP